MKEEKQEEKKEDGWIGGTTFYRRIFVEKDRLPSMVAKTKDDECVREEFARSGRRGQAGAIAREAAG